MAKSENDLLFNRRISRTSPGVDVFTLHNLLPLKCIVILIALGQNTNEIEFCLLTHEFKKKNVSVFDVWIQIFAVVSFAIHEAQYVLCISGGNHSRNSVGFRVNIVVGCL